MIRVLCTEVNTLKFNTATDAFEGRVRVQYRSDQETGTFTAEIATTIIAAQRAPVDRIADAMVAKAIDYVTSGNSCGNTATTDRLSLNIFRALRHNDDRAELRPSRPHPHKIGGLFGLKAMADRLATTDTLAAH